jgi:Met-10+ like-protein
VRHCQVFRRADVLWDITRPFYDRTLALVARHGLQRNMNGSDLLRVHSSCRGVQENYEPEVWSQLLNSLQPGDFVVDVGAHIGLYSVAMATRVGPQGKVYACEPDASNRKFLVEHIRLNGL